ncbi:MAG: hypothetical protein ACXADW_16650 [Candidatus Hodarchaeales archaeon]|jgi:chromosome segregation ATPase
MDVPRLQTGRSRTVPQHRLEEQIYNLKRRVKELEDKVDKLQELVDQYEWAMGIGD